ncbi:MAG: hypothetical protein GYB25_00775 [Rhodobacteraceae bacterium]|nr:hypothetical protein [Paracoccaceae bacterium]
MKNFLAALSLFLVVIAGAAMAYERGDTAYVCSKNQKFMWVVGEDSWTACPVRILQKAGGSYKVLAHRKSCLMSGSSMISRGRERWVESHQLWPSRKACEGTSKKAAAKPRGQKINITNKCAHAISGFIYYKSLAGTWTQGKPFLIPGDGKTYPAWDAKTKNRIIQYYIYRADSTAVYGAGGGVRLPYKGKTVELSQFEAAQLPVHMVFCK